MASSSAGPSSPGRVQPSCTMARGKTETLIKGRDAGYRFAPQRGSRGLSAGQARAETRK